MSLPTETNDRGETSDVRVGGAGARAAGPLAWRQACMVLLAVNSGGLDAVGFTALGGAFTSVMTGNMILLGVSLATANRALAVRSILALACYMAGTFLGARIAGAPQPDDPPWPRPVTRALVTELALLAFFAIGWWGSGGHPASALQQVLLGVDAVALGIQGTAVLRLGESGLSTTYMTGTLTTLVSALSHRKHPRNVVPSAQLLVALISGAAAAVLLARHAAPLLPALQLVPLAATLAVATRQGASGPARP
jgi:uncharacterized membrane protein YoaK (UPF0700 family)